jgi:hypothetical protein
VDWVHRIQPFATSTYTLEMASRAKISTMLCSALQVTHLGLRLLDFIYRVAEGHPVFSISLAIGNKESKMITFTEEGGSIEVEFVSRSSCCMPIYSTTEDILNNL